MTTQTPLSTETEDQLAGFLTSLPEAEAITARTLAHAWASGGGRLQVGRLSVRLTSGDPGFTAGTLYAPHGAHVAPRLELCRVVLESRGVPHDAWVHWSDEFADLAHHGFDPAERFPALVLRSDVSPPEVARLAMGLRDLARMVEA
jgi:hypothetical protein